MAYEFNGAAVQRVERFGAELCPVVILDDYLLDTAALMDEAEHAHFGLPPGGFYPGLNAPLPQAYVIALVKALRPTLDSVFGVPAASEIQLMGYFALAVHSAEDLQPVQRVPHYDTSDPGQLALLHYLCGSGQGGTGFYRHDATGFETIDETRRARFRNVTLRELAECVPAHHVSALTPGYTQVGTIEVRFNRLIIYRANTLHSGLLDISRLDPDPRQGRLTANSFLRTHQNNI